MILELVMPLRKRKKQPRKKKYISSKEKQVEEARAWGRWSAVVTSEWSSWRNTFAAPGLYMYLFLGFFFLLTLTYYSFIQELPGHGESSQCLMWRILSSLDKA